MLSELPQEFSMFKELILSNQINMPTQNDKIYKEECLVTCDTVYAEHGLYICMATWRSFAHSILDSYVSKSNNYVFLNIHKIRQVKDQSEE